MGIKKICSFRKLNSSGVQILPFFLQVNDAVTKGVVAKRNPKMRWPGKQVWKEGQQSTCSMSHLYECPHYTSTVIGLQSPKGLKDGKKYRVVLCTKKSPNRLSGIHIYWCDKNPVAFVFSTGQALDEMMFKGLSQTIL